MTEHGDDTGRGDDTAHGDGPGFAAAIDELMTLVAELESDSLDVDHLAQRVERAAELVSWCRERLDVARFQVEEVLVRLDDESPTDADASGGDEPADDHAGGAEHATGVDGADGVDHANGVDDGT